MAGRPPRTGGCRPETWAISNWWVTEAPDHTVNIGLYDYDLPTRPPGGENGVVAGYGDGNYHPEIVVTGDQMAVYVARACDLPM